MHARRLMSLVLSIIAAATGVAAYGQTTAGSGTVIVLPLAANIPGAYVTTVFVQNPNANEITLNVDYYQSDSATPPGSGTPYTCSPLTVPANMAVTFDLASQCTFTGTDNFGVIVLEDATSTYKTNPFFAYSRSELPVSPNGEQGNGFSVEGFPVGNFSSENADALGLKKSIAAPHYRSNCFVGALNEPVTYQILLHQGETGALLGTIPSSPATLGAYHSVRFLDIFNAAGLADTDYSNVRATFVNSASSAMIGYCTLETSDNGSADFRIAKSIDARDSRQARQVCYGQDSCGTVTLTNPPAITDITKKNIHYLIVDQPDFVKCDLVSTRASDLEIMLRGPGDPQTAPQFDVAALPPPYDASPYTSGGAGLQGFYIYTGEKSTINLGATTRWYIDVSFNQSSVNTTTPIPYGITCTSGNGTTVPWMLTTGPANP